MPDVNVILQRRKPDGSLVDWLLEADGTDPVTVKNTVPISIDSVTTPVVITSVQRVFRTDFTTALDPLIWDTVTTGNHLINFGGDSSGASYLRISLSPFVQDDEYSITTKAMYQLPVRLAFGLSLSQRVIGQEVFVGVVGAVLADGSVPATAQPADVAITGATGSVASNVLTLTITSHPFKGGDRVMVIGTADTRLIMGPLVVTVVDANTITVPLTLANGSYSTVGGSVRFADPMANTSNAFGLLMENATVTNSSFVSRRNSAKFRTSNQTISSTTAVQSNTSPYTDAFNATGVQELFLASDEGRYRSYAADSTASPSGLNKYSHPLPDESLYYKIRIRAKNLKTLTVPVARIVTIAKTGTTTATVTTDVPHGLTATTDLVNLIGMRDQTNFPNITGITSPVASVIDATHFTVVIGSATTTNSVGGVVWKILGGQGAPGAFGQSIQSVQRTNNVLTVIGSGTWTTPLPGEFVQLHGLDAAAAVEGAYKVLRVSGTTLELASVGADFGLINTGGAVIRRTDVRIHFARMLDYARQTVEVIGGQGQTSDINAAVPVAIAGSATLTINTPAVTQSTGSTTTQWLVGSQTGTLVNDVASAAITTTTTTTAVTPGLTANIGASAHSFNIVVTAVSGTTPTMDVVVQESMDNGTNWKDIYHFPRITATGVYVSPLIRSQWGTRFRYVQTITGTTPSFTRAVNRIQFAAPAPLHRQFFDRTIVNTTLNSVTPTFDVDGCDSLQLLVNMGAITTTAPQFQLQGSEDGASWYNLGAPLVGVATAVVVLHIVDVIPKFVRALVSTAGVGSTLNHVAIKGIGR